MKEEDLFTACWAAINGSFSFWGTDAAKWGWGTGCNLDVGRCAAALQLTLVYFFLAVAHTVGKRRCMQWRIMRK